MTSPNQATPAGTDPVANSEGAKAVLPPRMDLQPFPMAEGLLVTLSVMAVGFVAFLVVYGLQCAGVIG